MPPNEPAPTPPVPSEKPAESPEGSENAIRSLARKLGAYAETLPPQDRALLEHVLLTALPPHERLRFTYDATLLSESERSLLDRLSEE
jgi:hypothetical protein